MHDYKSPIKFNVTHKKLHKIILSIVILNLSLFLVMYFDYEKLFNNYSYLANMGMLILIISISLIHLIRYRLIVSEMFLELRDISTKTLNYNEINKVELKINKLTLFKGNIRISIPGGVIENKESVFKFIINKIKGNDELEIIDHDSIIQSYYDH